MLSVTLAKEGIAVKQAESVTIVGEDVDLLIILTALAGYNSNIYMLKPGRGNTESKLYTPSSTNFGLTIKNNILFLHAFSGGDTTSAFFRQGKLKFVKLLEKNELLQDLVSIFREPFADPEKIAEAGKSLIVELYGTNGCKSLCDARYQCFAQTLNKANFSLASLPPTDAAA